jgi:hypothetical protein
VIWNRGFIAHFRTVYEANSKPSAHHRCLGRYCARYDCGLLMCIHGVSLVSADRLTSLVKAVSFCLNEFLLLRLKTSHHTGDEGTSLLVAVSHEKGLPCCRDIGLKGQARILINHTVGTSARHPTGYLAVENFKRIERTVQPGLSKAGACLKNAVKRASRGRERSTWQKDFALAFCAPSSPVAVVLGEGCHRPTGLRTAVRRRHRHCRVVSSGVVSLLLRGAWLVAWHSGSSCASLRHGYTCS